MNKDNTIFKASAVWAQIDPALLDDGSALFTSELDQESRLALRIKSGVLAKIAREKSPRAKPPLQRIARYAWMAAAVVVLAGVSWLFANILPVHGTNPTVTANTHVPTQQTTKINPTGATQATQATKATTAATTMASQSTAKPTLSPGSVVRSDQYPDLDHYKLPEQGQVLMTAGVQKGIDDRANDYLYFFIQIMILPPELYANPRGEAKCLDADWPDLVEAQEREAAAEIERLTALKYDVFIYETWVYASPSKEKQPCSILAGLLTKEQLLNFPASGGFGYIIDWVRNGDGVVNWGNDA